MKKVRVKIEQASDGKFWCHTEDAIAGGHLTSTGQSVKEAKDDLMSCWADAKADLQEQGLEMDDVQFEYKYDLRSFFDYFSFLNVNEIARRANINPSLMRQYRSGVKNAGESTYKKLSACLQGIQSDLQAATF